MQFIGHTRFSVYSYQSEKFAATRGKTDEVSYRDWLYGTSRLVPRTEIFLEESLPQIERAIGDRHNVKHIVCYSASLPQAYLSALQEAERRYAFLHLHEVRAPVSGTAPPIEAVREAAQAPVGLVQRLGIYRLDDDDLIAQDYFDRMAHYVSIAEPGWRISLGYGYSAIRSRGHYYFTRRDYHPMSSVGLMSVVDLSADGNLEGLHDTPHQHSDTGGPVIVDSQEPGFFRTRHAGQDNILAKNKGQEFLSSAVVEMRRWQPEDVKDVTARFPVLAGKLHKALTPMTGAESLLDEPAELGLEPLHFGVPHDRGCVLVMELEGRFEKGQVRVYYTLKSGPAQNIADRSLRDYFSPQLIAYDPDQGYYEPVPTNEKGPKRHVVIHCPEGVSLTGVSLVSRRKKSPVVLKSLSVRPLLDTDASGL